MTDTTMADKVRAYAQCLIDNKKVISLPDGYYSIFKDLGIEPEELNNGEFGMFKALMMPTN